MIREKITFTFKDAEQQRRFHERLRGECGVAPSQVVEVDSETHVVVPRKLPPDAREAARSAMPCETDHWLEGGKLHARQRALHECVDPQTVWDAALAALGKPSNRRNGHE